MTGRVDGQHPGEFCTCPECAVFNDGRYDDDDTYDDDGQDTSQCHWCGGDGFDQCNDRIQCTKPHDRWGNCYCSSCNGSGLAKDMTIW